MADCIGTGFPQFSCALVQMRYSIGWLRSYFQEGDLWRVDSEGNGEREEKAIAVQVELRIKKIVRWFKLINFLNHFTIFLVEFHRKLVEKMSQKIPRLFFSVLLKH